MGHIGFTITKRYLSSSLSFNSKHYDIVVAGGGMVGATLACCLGKNEKLANRKILLVESSKAAQYNLTEKYSNRVSSLNSASIKLLKRIKAWDYIEKTRYAPVNRIQMWDALSDAGITFENDNPEEPLACVVENDVLLEGVRRQLSETKNVEVVYEAKVKKCTADDDKDVEIQLENEEKFTCKLLVGCDGFNSFVRNSLEFHKIDYNYQQMGVVATLKLNEDCDNSVAWQRHLPNSEIVALLPLREGLSSLVWSTSTKDAKKLLQLSDEAFVDSLNEALCKVYPTNELLNKATSKFDELIHYLNLPASSSKQLPPKIVGCENRAGFPLGLCHSTNYIRKGVALVGDAAHRIHPLAGQGVNLGFGDVICLNKVLGEVAYSGGKLECVSNLKQYETERQKFNVPMMLGVHALHHLYSTQLTPIVALRSLGLQATNALTPLKNFLMRQAAG